ncbi:hypothetical protein TTHERM_00138210 (macronuclear) [Tetrahymena thermophila SB210]|uniref:Kinase domain protein n=1 Tax=Tetrahymena thermophila (strain SB210) TaxID=312017 RepID=I7LVR2_TETTS|nr:hypothetical protein TTHERM_00138210 [Tetrahymena thermophila SB210]EAR99558.2 hypothetical protein TTHERM_00138210 [Tetrahymena thermophila SB210]|eukprot:XP_001019803.2 hypothetical protein TTHERM_00138210 [Tetrahymena thermophila SB210]
MDIKVCQWYSSLSKNLQIKPGIYLVDNNDQKIIINEDTKQYEIQNKLQQIKSIFTDVTQINSADQIEAFINILKFLTAFSQNVEEMKIILWNNNLLHQRNGHYLHNLISSSTNLKSLILDLGNNLLSDQGISQIFQFQQQPLHNLTSLNLSVSFNKITDYSLEDVLSFVTNLPNIRYLKFDIMNNQVSVNGLVKIIESFNLLKNLCTLDLNIMQNQKIEENYQYLYQLGKHLSNLQNVTTIILHLHCPDDDFISAVQMMKEEIQLIEQLKDSKYLRKLEILNFNVELDSSCKSIINQMASQLMNIDLLLEQRIDTGMDIFQEFEIIDKMLRYKYIKLIEIIIFHKKIKPYLTFNPLFIYLDLYL